MSFHTPHGSARHRLPWSWTSFDYRTLCEELWEQCDARFEVAKVERREGDTVHTDRGPLRAPLIVDALGWRRVLGPGANVQPPEAMISRGLEVHPEGGGVDLDVWIDRSLIRRGYAWSVPADGEQRVGVGSYEPRDHVKEPTRDDRRAGRRAARPLPGQLVPAQAAPRHRGRRVLRRRLGRPLLPALGRGDPHRVLLRHRLWPRAAGRAGGRAGQGARTRVLRRVLAPPRARLRVGAEVAAADPGAAAAVARAPARARRPAAGAPSAPTAGTCARPTRRSLSGGRGTTRRGARRSRGCSGRARGGGAAWRSRGAASPSRGCGRRA